VLLRFFVTGGHAVFKTQIKLSAPRAEFNTMKMITSVVKSALALGLLAAPLALSAKSLEDTYIESYKGRDSLIPAPISVVTPEVSARYAGQTVDLEFNVDESGRPSEIVIRQFVDRELATTLRDAVAQWQFAPARIDGKAIARKVVLPLRIVDSSGSSLVAMK